MNAKFVTMPLHQSRVKKDDLKYHVSTKGYMDDYVTFEVKTGYWVSLKCIPLFTSLVHADNEGKRVIVL